MPAVVELATAAFPEACGGMEASWPAASGEIDIFRKSPGNSATTSDRRDAGCWVLFSAAGTQ